MEKLPFARQSAALRGLALLVSLLVCGCQQLKLREQNQAAANLAAETAQADGTTRSDGRAPAADVPLARAGRRGSVRQAAAQMPLATDAIAVGEPHADMGQLGSIHAGPGYPGPGHAGHMHPGAKHPGAGPLPPTELSKTSLPDYVIEPPDVLLIEAIKVVPKPPYKISALDVLQVLATGTVAGSDVAGNVSVDPGGRIDLGPLYGKVAVAGLTMDQAKEAITKHLLQELQETEVSVSLVASSGQQQISGEHLVGPDGTVNLGQYGSVYVSGMTIEQARAAIEQSLSRYLEKPVVSVDVFAFNSKTYYIIVEGAGFGDSIVRVPITGNETVLDAIAQLQRLNHFSSKRIFIARPAPGGVGCDQVLPVKWDEIVKGGSTATNYQILPGDRIFIEENKLVKFDSALALLTEPATKLFGASLLGAQTIQTFNRFPTGQSE